MTLFSLEKAIDSGSGVTAQNHLLNLSICRLHGGFKPHHVSTLPPTEQGIICRKCVEFAAKTKTHVTIAKSVRLELGSGFGKYLSKKQFSNVYFTHKIKFMQNVFSVMRLLVYADRQKQERKMFASSAWHLENRLGTMC